MITGPQRKFCEAYALDQNGTSAYLSAYPKSTEAAAGVSAHRLLKSAKILAEIARIRRKAEEKAGSAILTLAEKRSKLAGVVRAANGQLDGSEVRISDKLAAIKLDNDLAGEGSEAGANDALGELLAKLRK